MSSQVSRPVLIALLATVLLGAVWFVALRPKSDSGSSAPAAAKPAVASAAGPATSGGPNAPGVAGLKHAIDKANGAVATSKQSADKLQAQSDAVSGTATTPAPSTSAATPAPSASAPAASTPSTSAAVPAAGATKTKAPAPTPVVKHAAKLTVPQRVQRALDDHKVLVFLFYNPRGADDRAMHHELSQIKLHHGSVVVLSAVISQLQDYKMITAKAEIDSTPTLLFFDKTGAVAAVHGFADPAEVNQRVLDVLKGGVGGH